MPSDLEYETILHPAPELVWDKCKFSALQRANIPAFRDWLRTNETELSIFLADATLSEEAPREKFERIDVSELESLIARNCAPKSAFLFYGRILKTVVRQLSRSGHLIPTPKLLESLRRELHPCADNFVDYHRRVKSWSNGALKWIGRLAESDGNNVPRSLIALASILWGRALHPDTVLAIVEACSKPSENFRFARGQLYADLSLPWGGIKDQELQRWYADGGLACLIAMAEKAGSREVSEAPSEESNKTVDQERRGRILQELIEEIRNGLSDSVDEGDLPTRISEIIEAVNMTLVSYVPQIFRRFWTREIHARSLLPNCIGRIYGEEFLAPQALQQSGRVLPDEIDPEPDEAKEESGDGNNSEEPPEWIRQLRAALKGGQAELELIKKRLKKLRTVLAASTPTARKLADFAIWLLENGSLTTGAQWQVSTIRNCVISVARRLGQLVGDTDLGTLDPINLAAFYRQAIELATDAKDPNRLKDSVTMAVREFHRFLVHEDPKLAINESEVFQSYRGLFSVDARIYSLEDIENALDKIEAETVRSRNPRKRSASEVAGDAAQFLIVMAFSIGSRRMENFWLRDVDFPGGDSVFIRPWGDHRLKTANATRVDPFRQFHMPPRFQQIVANWYRLYKRKGMRFIFRGKARDEKHIPVAEIIPIVHRALGKATEDPTAHLHILRHSCATWTFTRLFVSDLDVIPDLFPNLEATNKWIKESSKAFREALYKNTNVNNDHGWAISTLLGQSFPGVPLENYIHSMDRLSPIILGDSDYLDDLFSEDRPRRKPRCGKQLELFAIEPPRPGDVLLRDAARLSQGAFDRRIKTDSRENRDGALAEIVEEAVCDRIPRAKRQDPLRIPQTSWVFHTHEFLWTEVTSVQSPQELAPVMGIETKFATSMLQRAQSLYSLELNGAPASDMPRIPRRRPGKKKALSWSWGP